MLYTEEGEMVRPACKIQSVKFINRFSGCSDGPTREGEDKRDAYPLPHSGMDKVSTSSSTHGARIGVLHDTSHASTDGAFTPPTRHAS